MSSPSRFGVPGSIFCWSLFLCGGFSKGDTKNRAGKAPPGNHVAHIAPGWLAFFLMPSLAGGTVRLAFPVPCFSLFEKHARLVAAGPTGEVIGKPYGHASLEDQRQGAGHRGRQGVSYRSMA